MNQKNRLDLAFVVVLLSIFAISLAFLGCPANAEMVKEVDNVRLVASKTILEFSSEGEVVAAFPKGMFRVMNYTDGSEEYEVTVKYLVNTIRKEMRNGFHVILRHRENDPEAWFIFIKADMVESTPPTKAYIIYVET